MGKLPDLRLFSFDDSVWIPVSMSGSISRQYTLLSVTNGMNVWFHSGCYVRQSDKYNSLNKGVIDIIRPSPTASITAAAKMYAKGWRKFRFLSPDRFDHRTAS